MCCTPSPLYVEMIDVLEEIIAWIKAHATQPFQGESHVVAALAVLLCEWSKKKG